MLSNIGNIRNSRTEKRSRMGGGRKGKSRGITKQKLFFQVDRLPLKGNIDYSCRGVCRKVIGSHD